jgi:hypothetical protein
MTAGWQHILVLVCFIISFVLIDLDHTPRTFQNYWKALIGKPQDMSRGIFHTKLFFWCVLAFFIGVCLHLKMDGVI